MARLFRAIVHAKSLHAGDHYPEPHQLMGGFVANSMAAFGHGDTKKNVELTIMGKHFEITEMYRPYIEVAKLQGKKEANRTFEWAYGTEKSIGKRFIDAGKERYTKGGVLR